MEPFIKDDYIAEKSNVYVLQGDPVALKRPRFSDIGKVYDCQKQLKSRMILQLKAQHPKTPTLCGMLHLNIDFYFKLPKCKKSREHLLQQKYHVYKPDLSNLIKLIEDVCVDAFIIHDDCLIASISSRKLYSDEPKTEFYFGILRKQSEYTDADNEEIQDGK